MSPDEPTGSISVLVVARHPVRLEDLGLSENPALERAELIRSTAALETALDEIEPNVVIVDTGYGGGRSYELIAEVLASAPETRLLALTSSHTGHDEVALATRAGAAGFISVDASDADILSAIEAVQAGMTWFPQDDLRRIFTDVAGDLDVTHAERRSRMTGILIGLVPLTGLIAALMSFLWRKYLGQIGVRPVDLAIDPTSRVVDAIVGISLVIGVFGPLLFVRNWLEMLRETKVNRGPIAWLLRHRVLSQLLLSVVVLGVALFFTVGPDLFIVVVVGPLVLISIVGRAADLNEELPRIMRIEGIRPMRLFAAAVAGMLVFLIALSAEGILVGPDLGTRGANGLIVPRVLGFKAQPMRAFDVDGGREPREVLYLGGNADLYVLVDPCNDDEVELVSVGSTRLVVIDEVTCPE